MKKGLTSTAKNEERAYKCSYSKIKKGLTSTVQLKIEKGLTSTAKNKERAYEYS